MRTFVLIGLRFATYCQQTAPRIPGKGSQEGVLYLNLLFPVTSKSWKINFSISYETISKFETSNLCKNK